MNNRQRLIQAAKAAPKNKTKPNKYVLTVQQLIYVQAVNQKHAEELVSDNPPSVLFGGCGDYEGKTTLFSVESADSVKIVKAVKSA